MDIKYWFVAKNNVLMHSHICIYFLNSLYHQLTWVHITVYFRSSDQTWLFCFYYFILYTTINALQFILNIKILLQINRVLTTKKKSCTEFVSIKSKYSFLFRIKYSLYDIFLNKICAGIKQIYIIYRRT